MNHAKDKPMNFKHQRGVSLLEVLLTVVILSVGLLGSAMLQFNSVRLNNDAFLRSQATNLAYDMSDRIRANSAAAVSGSYDLAIDDDAPSSPSSIAANDIADWLNLLAADLPAGDGSIARNGNEFTVQVCWDESRDGSADVCFDFVTGI